VDEGIIAVATAGADLIWEHAGLAIPLELDFAHSGAQRLAREAAAAAIDSDLKSTVASPLLHSQLALADREISQPPTEKLPVVADLAGSLREQLASSASHQPGP
jgi:hypothetical protein